MRIWDLSIADVQIVNRPFAHLAMTQLYTYLGSFAVKIMLSILLNILHGRQKTYVHTLHCLLRTKEKKTYWFKVIGQNFPFSKSLLLIIYYFLEIEMLLIVLKLNAYFKITTFSKNCLCESFINKKKCKANGANLFTR